MAAGTELQSWVHSFFPPVRHYFLLFVLHIYLNESLHQTKKHYQKEWLQHQLDVLSLHQIFNRWWRMTIWLCNLIIQISWNAPGITEYLGWFYTLQHKFAWKISTERIEQQTLHILEHQINSTRNLAATAEDTALRTEFSFTLEEYEWKKIYSLCIYSCTIVLCSRYITLHSLSIQFLLTCKIMKYSIFQTKILAYVQTTLN